MSFDWFISMDDHLIEPARLWQERVPERHRDRAPRIVREGDSEVWVYEDRQIVTTGLNAVAGKKREEFSPEPINACRVYDFTPADPPGSETGTGTAS